MQASGWLSADPLVMVFSLLWVSQLFTWWSLCPKAGLRCAFGTAHAPARRCGERRRSGGRCRGRAGSAGAPSRLLAQPLWPPAYPAQVGPENFDRALRFYRVAIPGYLQYKLTDIRTRGGDPHARDDAFQKLHRIWAPDALDIILQLRGFYIKIGQVARSEAVSREDAHVATEQRS
eukprot:scaffold1175_cov248-Pinguiococcus_pyrenoidosus.AAC.11